MFHARKQHLTSATKHSSTESFFNSKIIKKKTHNKALVGNLPTCAHSECDGTVI